MNFTFKEWQFIRHCMECAGRDFEELMNTSKPSDKETSMYQIFKRQMEEAHRIVEKIENSEI